MKFLQLDKSFNNWRLMKRLFIYLFFAAFEMSTVSSPIDEEIHKSL